MHRMPPYLVGQAAARAMACTHPQTSTSVLTWLHSSTLPRNKHFKLPHAVPCCPLQVLFYTPLGLGKLGESWSVYSWIQAAG